MEVNKTHGYEDLAVETVASNPVHILDSTPEKDSKLNNVSGNSLLMSLLRLQLYFHFIPLVLEKCLCCSSN